MEGRRSKSRRSSLWDSMGERCGSPGCVALPILFRTIARAEMHLCAWKWHDGTKKELRLRAGWSLLTRKGCREKQDMCYN